ncbi:MAG: hypothetical protein AAF717_12225 [Bacteroidota bacterium]
MRRLFSTVFLLLVVACSNDDDSANDDPSDIRWVTGVRLVQSGGSPPIIAGNPNVLGQKILIFPNPAIGTFFVDTSLSETISGVWVRPGTATKSFDNIDFTEVLGSTLYQKSEIEANSVLSFPNTNTSNLSVDVSDLDSGYYRVFVEIDGAFYWENIFVANTNESVQEIIEFWNSSN